MKGHNYMYYFKKNPIKNHCFKEKKTNISLTSQWASADNWTLIRSKIRPNDRQDI